MSAADSLQVSASILEQMTSLFLAIRNTADTDVGKTLPLVRLHEIRVLAGLGSAVSSEWQDSAESAAEDERKAEQQRIREGRHHG